MTHNEKRTHWVKEGFISFGIGIIYGVTVTSASHPFDTIKTKMQAQAGFENSGMVSTFVKVFKAEGVKGLYRGCIPPLWGSGLFRSIQFSAFEATYTFLDNRFGRTHIPLTNGIETRVILGGIMAGACRSVIETPLDYAKIKRQMGQNWKLREVFTGFGITCSRACVLMPTYFIALDSFRRHFDDFFKSNILGPFLCSGCSAVAGWWVCWPLELMKAQVQGGYMNEKKMSVYARLKYTVNERGGFLALYRGILPGSIRSFLGNGTAMVVMQFCQKKVTEWGLRDD